MRDKIFCALVLRVHTLVGAISFDIFTLQHAPSPQKICPTIAEDEAGTCPYIPAQGIDINRNFPADFKSSDFEAECPSPSDCCSAHPGPMAFSEPETRAIRDTVRKFQPDAAISFHSQDFERTSILLYPYASPVDHDMDMNDKKRFQTWGKAMEPRRGMYSVRDPYGALGYRASGTCLDWMYGSEKVTAFVLESATPCGSRVCEEKKYGGRIKSTARLYARSGVILVELVLGAPAQRHLWSVSTCFLIVGTLLVAGLSVGRFHGMLLRLIRIIARNRDVFFWQGHSNRIEMQRMI